MSGNERELTERVINLWLDLGHQLDELSTTEARAAVVMALSAPAIVKGVPGMADAVLALTVEHGPDCGCEDAALEPPAPTGMYL